MILLSTNYTLVKREIIFMSLQNNKLKIRVGVMVAHRALTSTEQDRNLYPKPSFSFAILLSDTLRRGLNLRKL